MKEVTIEIKEDTYNHFKEQAEVYGRPVEDIIAVVIWAYYKRESEGEF